MVASANPAFMEASEMVASAALQLQPADPQDPSKARDICRHWAKGYCALGENCAFPHHGPSPAPASGGSVVVNGLPAEAIPSAAELRKQDLFAVVKSSVPCKDYQAAKCHRGDKCKFAHVGGGPQRRSVACRDWRQGRCTRGDACRYRHTGSRRQSDDQDCYDDDVQDEMRDTAPYVTTVKYVVSPAQQTIAAPAPSVQRIVRYYTTTAPTPQPTATLNGLPVAQTACDYMTPTPVQPVCDFNASPLTPLTPVCDFGMQSLATGSSPLSPPGEVEWISAPHVAPSPPPPQQPMMIEPPQHMSPPLTAAPPSVTPEELCADADAAVFELRRRAEEMEAHAASLRIQAAQAMNVYPEVPASNMYVTHPAELAPAPMPQHYAPARQSGSSAGSGSEDTTPTSPRRSSSTCSGGSEGGEWAPSPPCGAPYSPDPSLRKDYENTSQQSQQSQPAPVMVHDPYAF